MTMNYKNILVPVAVAGGDDMPLAEHLVDVAIDLARASDGKLTIMYVEPMVPPVMPLDIGLMPGNAIEAMYAVRDANRDIAKKNLHALAERAKAVGVSASSELAEATTGVGETIAKVAAQTGANLVVLCSHARRGVARLFLGSVAERTAHLSTVPVLIVRAPPVAAR